MLRVGGRAERGVVADPGRARFQHRNQSDLQSPSQLVFKHIAPNTASGETIKMSITTTTTATRTLNAENVLRLVPEVDTNLAQSHRAHDQHDDLEGYDEEQIRLMDEVCIVLDEDDQPIGSASKKVCRSRINCEYFTDGS